VVCAAAGMCGVRSSRHVWCAQQHACVVCAAAGMCGVRSSRHVWCAQQHACLMRLPTVAGRNLAHNLVTPNNSSRASVGPVPGSHGCSPDPVGSRVHHCGRSAQGAREAAARTNVSSGSCDAHLLRGTLYKIVHCCTPWPAGGRVRTQPAPVLQRTRARGACPLPLAWLQGRTPESAAAEACS